MPCAALDPNRHHGVVLESLPPARRRFALAVIVVVSLALLVAASLVIGQLKRNVVPPITPQEKGGPVVVLPGYGGRLALLVPIVVALRAEHRKIVVFTPTDHETGDLRVQAKRLRDLVNRTLDKTHAKSVDVVGYSAGAMIARLWVRNYGGDRQARRVLTIAAPNHGTKRSKIEALTAGGDCPATCVQLSDGSSFLSKLNAGDETPSGPTWITIRSATDDVVTPDSSVILDGALNLLVQDGCPVATTNHVGMPSDPYVLAALATTLGNDAPQAPSFVKC